MRFPRGVSTITEQSSYPSSLVYLVGGGTHPGSGLPVIFESAKISAKLLADDLGVETDWNRRPRTTSEPLAVPSRQRVAQIA